MVANKFTQRPQLDGSGSLYKQKFLEQFSFTIIPPEPVVPPIVAIEEAKPSKAKTYYVIGVVIAAIIAAIIFA
jgi:hypothetical protein